MLFSIKSHGKSALYVNQGHSQPVNEVNSQKKNGKGGGGKKTKDPN